MWYLLLLLLGGSSAFEYEDCGIPDQKIAFIDSLVISPDPATIPGDMTVSVKIRVTEDIPPGAIVKLKIIRHMNIFGQAIDLPLPCLGDIGSCDTEACRFLKSHEERACPFFPEDKPCQCPITAGDYVGTDLVVPFPDFGPLLNQLVAGKYEFQFIVQHGERQLACVRAKLELAAKKE
ncbi:ganglioside GM2 activator-like [Centruroides sculpturatus]|uniref:ganglioside GM2 activator-like n=1 Tax=Centruroides sculpturatus TaxID=218467 RepID=UPI000C6D67EE|nr:ganglioside GM2 activator-like [Centruroides sculpturatus]